MRWRNRVDPVQSPRRPTLFRSPRRPPGRGIRSPPSTVVPNGLGGYGQRSCYDNNAPGRPPVPMTRGTGGTRPTRRNTVRYVTSLYLFIVHYNNILPLMAAHVGPAVAFSRDKLLRIFYHPPSGEWTGHGQSNDCDPGRFCVISSVPNHFGVYNL